MSKISILEIARLVGCKYKTDWNFLKIHRANGFRVINKSHQYNSEGKKLNQ